jgi:GTP-binding protein
VPRILPEPPRIQQANFAFAARSLGELPPPAAIEIAFAGRSNVGKSSLMNNLLGTKHLVRTSSTPGCTRQLGFFSVHIARGPELCFVDLPGYGDARRSKTERESWAPLIEGYLTERPTLALVIILLDARRGLEQDDLELLAFLSEARRTAKVQTLLVATKLDKVKSSARKPALRAITSRGQRPVIGYSSRDSTGRRELWFELLQACGFSTSVSPLAPAPTSDSPSSDSPTSGSAT